jgi:hypothetical protein
MNALKAQTVREITKASVTEAETLVTQGQAIAHPHRRDTSFPGSATECTVVHRLQRRVHARRSTLLLSTHCHRSCFALSAAMRSHGIEHLSPIKPVSAIRRKRRPRSLDLANLRWGLLNSPPMVAGTRSYLGTPGLSIRPRAGRPKVTAGALSMPAPRDIPADPVRRQPA